jgi:hypothetical protein
MIASLLCVVRRAFSRCALPGILLTLALGARATPLKHDVPVRAWMILSDSEQGAKDVIGAAPATASIKTAPGGRTSAFDGDRIYLNVQEGPGQSAEVRCYAVR